MFKIQYLLSKLGQFSYLLFDLNVEKGYDFPISAKRSVTGDANVKSSAHPQLFLLWNSSAKAAEKGMAIRLYKVTFLILTVRTFLHTPIRKDIRQILRSKNWIFYFHFF